MTRTYEKPWTPGLLAAALVGAFFGHGASLLGTAQTPTAQVTDTRVYGMPQAEVFQEDYSGLPIVGDAVTLLPNIAPLAPGNRNPQYSYRCRRETDRGRPERTVSTPGRLGVSCPVPCSTSAKAISPSSR